MYMKVAHGYKELLWE